MHIKIVHSASEKPYQLHYKSETTKRLYKSEYQTVSVTYTPI